MRDRYKKALRWTLLACLVIPLAPVLFIGLLMAKNIVNAFLSPTSNSARHDPDPHALAGLYVATDKAANGAQIELRPDHTAFLESILGFNGVGESLDCQWNGSANWSLRQHSGLELKITQRMVATGEKPCTDNWVSFTVLEQKAPYRLFMYIGDPDNGDGYTFSSTESRLR